MKKLLLLCLICGISSVLYAQSDKERVAANIKKANSFIFSNIDSAIFFAKTALLLAQEGNPYSEQVFDAHRTIGLIYEENNRLNESKEAYQAALELAEKYLTNKEKFKIYTDWAIVHKKMGQYKIAYEYHYKTIEEAEKVGNWEIVENGYHGLGTMYSMMSDFDKSISVYHKSIEAAEKWRNTEGVVLTNQNISNIYLKAKNYEMAKRHIGKTYEMALKLGDSVRLAAVLRVFGKIELALGNLNEALEKNIAAKNIFEKKGNKTRLAESYLALADIKFQQKNYSEADICFKKCDALKTYFTPYVFAEYYTTLGKFYLAQNKNKEAISAFKTSLLKTDSLGFKEIARENHMALAAIFKNINQIDTAFEHIEKANRLSEAMFEEDKQKTMTESQFKFDIQNRDLQIETQSKSLAQSRLIRTLLAISLLIVSIILIFTWQQVKAKQKAIQYSELLMKELHHRVKNNLQTVTSIMRLQARHIADPSVSAVLAESRSRLEAISMIHQQLYSGQDVQSVNFKLFLYDLIEKLRFTYGMNEKPIKVDIQLKEDLINVDLALPLGLIVNELLTNSFKYAYPSVREPKLTVHINEKHLYYADNGKGLPENFDEESNQSFGTQLITSLAHQLQGKYKFGNKDGMFFNLIFNKNQELTAQ